MSETTNPPMPVADPEAVDYLGRLLQDSDGAPSTFLILSDEEVIAIDQGIDPEFSLCPWAEAQDDLETGAFARFGERSLVLRGLVTPDVDVENAEVSMEISDELRLAAEARRSGIGFVRMAATYDGTRTGCVAVLQPMHGAFEEEVGAEGFHYLTACGYDDAVDRLAAWALPGDGGHESTGELRMKQDQWAAWAVNELGVDARHVEIDLYLPASAETMEVRHWMVAHSDDEAVLARLDDEDTEAIVVEATSPTALASTLRDRLVRAVGLVQP